VHSSKYKVNFSFHVVHFHRITQPSKLTSQREKLVT